MNTKNKTKLMTSLGLLVALTMLLSATPLGFIPIGPINATTIHIPVIIGAILLGRKGGLIMGLFFGLFSLFRAYTVPSVTAVIFMDPLVSLVPRIIWGYLAGLFFENIKKVSDKNVKTSSLILALLLGSFSAYKTYMSFIDGTRSNQISFSLLSLFLILVIILLTKTDFKDSFGAFLTASLATMMNTVLVLGSVYLLHAKDFAEKTSMDPDKVLKAIIGIASLNGVIEIIASAIIVTAISQALRKIKLI